jgi:hypothetical protein
LPPSAFKVVTATTETDSAMTIAISAAIVAANVAYSVRVWLQERGRA